MAEIRTQKLASTKQNCEGFAKLCSAPVLKGKLHPLLQLHAVVSSPVFVGENLARFGSFIALVKNVYGGFAALYSLISTRAGALPKKNTGTPPRVANFVLLKRAMDA
jgi:hypothetical protein